MVGLLFKTALYKMTNARTFFINFQFNRQITKELFKSDLMKFLKNFRWFPYLLCEFCKLKKKG